MAKRKIPAKKAPARSETAEESREPELGKNVIVSVPRTSVQKMMAICDLAASIKSLADALCSTNVKVEITGCEFRSTGTGISIQDDGC